MQRSFELRDRGIVHQATRRVRPVVKGRFPLPPAVGSLGLRAWSETESRGWERFRS